MSCNTKSVEFRSLGGRLLNLGKDSVNTLIFLDTECPICRKYQGSFRDILKKHPGGSFAFVFCGKQDEREVKAYCAYDSIPLSSVFLDRDYALARHFGARVTPQAIILKGNREVYSGMIDNRFESLGDSRPAASINYVENALFSLSKNEKIPVTHTEAVGCFIEPQ